MAHKTANLSPIFASFRTKLKKQLTLNHTPNHKIKHISNPQLTIFQTVIKDHANLILKLNSSSALASKPFGSIFMPLYTAKSIW